MKRSNDRHEEIKQNWTNLFKNFQTQSVSCFVSIFRNNSSQSRRLFSCPCEWYESKALKKECSNLKREFYLAKPSNQEQTNPQWTTPFLFSRKTERDKLWTTIQINKFSPNWSFECRQIITSKQTWSKQLYSSSFIFQLNHWKFDAYPWLLISYHFRRRRLSVVIENVRRLSLVIILAVNAYLWLSVVIAAYWGH